MPHLKLLLDLVAQSSLRLDRQDQYWHIWILTKRLFYLSQSRRRDWTRIAMLEYRSMSLMRLYIGIYLVERLYWDEHGDICVYM